MSKNNDIAATSLASTLAGFIAKVVVHPIDTVKAKVQVNRTRIDNLKDFNKGLIAEIIQKTYSAEGMKGFFPGVGLSAFGSTVAFSAYMTTYEYSKNHLATTEVPNYSTSVLQSTPIAKLLFVRLYCRDCFMRILASNRCHQGAAASSI